MNQRVNWPITILIALGSLIILFPLYITISIALKSPQELAESALSLPLNFHWDNFTRAIEATNFFASFKNSALITFFTLVFTILSNSLVAYAIARNMHRKLFRMLYYYFVSALFIPFPIIMLPIVKQTSAIGLNNPIGLTILYVVYGMAMNIFIYVGYIRSIPVELEEAAIMDGSSTWGVFWKVIFPLLTPINATIGILTCLWAWNDFLLPLVILSDSADYTLPLVQYVFQTEFGTDYNLAFASYLLSMAPMVIIYLFAQRWIIGGVVKGAIK